MTPAADGAVLAEAAAGISGQGVVNERLIRGRQLLGAWGAPAADDVVLVEPAYLAFHFEMGDLKAGWRRPVGEDGLMDIVALDDAVAVDAASLVPVNGDLHPAPGGVSEWLKIRSVARAAPEAAVGV